MNGWHFAEDGYVCGKCRDKLNIEGFAVENRIGRKSCGLCGCDYDDLHLIDYKVVNAALAAKPPNLEWVDVTCTCASCRGLKYGKGFPVRVPKGDEHKAICSECFSK